MNIKNIIDYVGSFKFILFFIFLCLIISYLGNKISDIHQLKIYNSIFFYKVIALRKDIKPLPRIVLVNIDDQSIESELGVFGPNWRRHHNHLIDRLKKAKIIAFDMYFESESIFDTDLAAKILSTQNVVIGHKISTNKKSKKIYSVAKSGYLDIPKDNDRIFRRYSPIKEIYSDKKSEKNKTYKEYHHEPSFVFRILQLFYGLKYNESDNKIYGVEYTNNLLKLDYLIKIPTDKDGSIFFRDIKEKTKFVELSYLDVLNGDFDEILIEDNIVLIGASGEWTRDYFDTPYGTKSGLLIHALTLNTIMTKNYVRYYHQIFVFLVLSIFSFIFLLLLSRNWKFATFFSFFTISLATISNLFTWYFPIIAIILVYLFSFMFFCCFRDNITKIYQLNKNIQKYFILSFCFLCLISISIITGDFNFIIGFACSLAVTITYDLYNNEKKETDLEEKEKK